MILSKEAYGQLRDRVYGQHSKPMSSFFVCTHRTARIFRAWEAVASAACPPTPALQSTGLPRLTEWMVGWASSKSEFLMSDLLQNCSKAVLMGVEAPKAGSTDSLGGRSQSASREVNARDQLGTEERSMQRVSSVVEYLMLTYRVNRGPHRLRHVACFGPLNDAAECKVEIGIKVLTSGWGALVPGVDMSVLASFAARGAKGPDERSGPQRWQSI
jgi:hypothetical protein